MKAMKKTISVLMGVYNAERTVKQAIRSIQAQTCADWELICCDDGSSDNSYRILVEEAALDDRIIVIRNEQNHGLGYTLNRCFERAGGEYIARMDADDESLPERFARELAFLEAGSCEIVSTAMVFFADCGELKTTQVIPFPQSEELIKGSPIAHAPCMMRRECLEKIGGYSEDRSTLRVEDTDLWIRLYAAGFRCGNLAEPLYRYCFDQEAVKRQKMKYRLNSAIVRWKGCKTLRLPAYYRLYALRPIAIGLIPPRVRYGLHRLRR